MNKLKLIANFLKENRWLVLIIIIGLIFRLYNYRELFIYNHDQDLIGWFIKDVVVNGHIRLVGQETSSKGIFIGPIFYYFMIPFYLLSNFDPLGGYWGVLILGLLTIFSFYFVLSKVFSKRVGLISSLIYALSAYTVFNDRWMVPTMTFFLWSIWFLYSLYYIYTYKDKLRGYILSGVLIGFIWHINMALIVLIPVVIYAMFIAKSKIKLKHIGSFLSSIILISLPLIFFEVRHGFLQSKYFLESLLVRQNDVISGMDKFLKVLRTVSLTAQKIAFGNQFQINYLIFVLFLLLLFVLLLLFKQLKKPYSIFLSFWIFFYLSFFSLYSKILSEYYLDGMVVVYIILFALLLNLFYIKKKLIFYILMMGFIFLQTKSLITQNIDRSLYLERKSLVGFIKEDSNIHGFPCVSVSYITDPGYEFGYRYLIWNAGLITKKVGSGVPVYSIVFPLSKVDKLDKYFGALGVILPNYQEFDIKKVEDNCGDSDYNITEPMWGLPQ